MNTDRIYELIKRIMKPGKLAQYRLRNIKKKTLDKLTLLLSLAVVMIVLVSRLPYRDFADFVLSSIGIVLLYIIIFSIFTITLPKGIRITAYFLYIPAKLYDIADDKLNHVSRKKRTNFWGGGLNQAPRAEVGIKYFIEREKNIQINHAEILR